MNGWTEMEEYSYSQRERDDIYRQLDEVRNDLELSEYEKDELQDEFEELKEELEKANDELKKRAKVIKYMRDENTRLSNRIIDLENEIERLRNG